MITCAVLIASWLCAGCMTGTCDLPSRAEASKPLLAGPSAYTITVSAEKPATIREEALTVELAGIQDHRCAVEVKCVWAGYAEITLRVTKAGHAAAPVIVGSLAPSAQGESAAVYGDYRFSLVNLEPPNSMSKPVAQALYRATLDVVRRTPQ